MHGHHQDITKVNLLITEPSQVSGVGPKEGEQQAPLHPCGSRGDGSRVSASHPETATPCGAKQQRSPIPGRQPQQVASLHPRAAKVTCPVYKQITSRSSCLFEHCLEPRDVSKTGLCISQRPFHSLILRKIRLLLHSPCLPLSRCGYHFLPNATAQLCQASSYGEV